MRIFQLAKELNVDSQEIIDALEDMDVPVKSNLQAIDDALVAEIRELFKPRPKPQPRTVKDDAVQRALAEKMARERAAEEARRREEERKEAARRAALERAARKRAELEQVRRAAEEEMEAARREAAAATEEIEVPAHEEEAGVPAGGQQAATEPAATATADTPADATESPAPEAPAAEKAPAPPPPAGGGLGKAVVAPPPTTAKERAELLGKPLSELRPRTPVVRQTTPPPRRPFMPPGPGGPGSSAGAPPRRRKRKGKRPAAEARPAMQTRPQPDLPPVGEVRISEGITVKDIAERMGRKAKDVITKLFLEKRLVVTINHALDEETAVWVVEAFGGTPVHVGIEEEALGDAMTTDAEAGGGEALPRAPVVTMMGHVDHGKTSLLDAIKKTRVAEREAGGITQHIGAYKVAKEVEGTQREIVFLDTPGHEAFTLMRARGATVTDIIVLVVAADDGVMPQTVEAIDHARSAEVPLIVAVNKIDKPGANPDRVLQQLAEHDVLVEQFGGEVVACYVSAKTLEGLDHLLEMIVLQADLLELTADPERPASGTVLEARLDKTRGPVATVLIQNGTLRTGDVCVVGSILGRVRALVDEMDRRVDEAGPSTPIQVLGLEDVPQAGDQLQVFVDEQKARQIAMYRQQKVRDEQLRRRQTLPSLESLHEQIKAGEVPELPVILKADVQGSVEVLRKALTDLSTEEVQVKVIHAATGAVTETDVLLAQASRALIVGFNVRPQRGVRELAEREGVDIRLHTVIYKVTEEIEQAMLATLSPLEKEVYLGRAEVLQTFKVPKTGTIAGCRVVDGVIRRDAQVRLLRDNVVIYEGKVSSLKRFKEDAREVRSGFECGIGLERFNDLKIGDEIEAFRIELVKRESLGEKVEATD